jgi:hypothetical protein
MLVHGTVGIAVSRKQAFQYGSPSLTSCGKKAVVRKVARNRNRPRTRGKSFVRRWNSPARAKFRYGEPYPASPVASLFWQNSTGNEKPQNLFLSGRGCRLEELGKPAEPFGVRRGIAALVFFLARKAHPLIPGLASDKENTKAAIPRRTPKRFSTVQDDF